MAQDNKLPIFDQHFTGFGQDAYCPFQRYVGNTKGKNPLIVRINLA